MICGRGVVRSMLACRCSRQDSRCHRSRSETRTRRASQRRRAFAHTDYALPLGSRGCPDDCRSLSDPALKCQEREPPRVRNAAIAGRSFDTASAVEHPRPVLRLVQRLFALALTLALMAGNAAVCAGWMPSPEARLACCSEGGACPMHEGDSHGTGSTPVITQVQADNCCASSERENSSQPNPTFVAAISDAVLGTGVVIPASVPALVLSDGWRPAAPTLVGPIPRHVLLSVFLV
jgi:hypothetical protein